MTESRRRRRRRDDAAPAPRVVRPGIEGGRFKPLDEAEMARIHEAALTVLETVGLADAPAIVSDRVCARGGRIDDNGRLLFPRALIEDAVAGLRRDIVLHGRAPEHALELSGARVHFGSGGAAPSVVDLETGRYRPSTLRDLYDAARLVDALEHIHFFSRSLVARDMETPLALDVNTAYACLAGTSKHVAAAAAEGAHVRPIAEICAEIAGGAERFAAAPFLSLNVNHVVSPLRFIPEACAVIDQAALAGIPAHINLFGQTGASAPASLAGSIAQSVAEVLAGMVFAWLVNPRAPVVFGPRPLITDLRTGAMSGGCGEAAIAMAGAAQMARFYDLPSSCIAGATDAKAPDAQSGFEKALAVSLAAHAGCNLITQACGMQASLMGVAFESYVIDNDMLGAIQRTLRGVEASAENLAAEVIEAAVRGEGHFLGAPDTMARMQADYLYPEILDRRSVEEWEAAGSPDIRETACARAREILATHYPRHIDPAVDARLRERFEIRLPLGAMRAKEDEA